MNVNVKTKKQKIESASRRNLIAKGFALVGPRHYLLRYQSGRKTIHRSRLVI
jgi:hypothetical protein